MATLLPVGLPTRPPTRFEGLGAGEDVVADLRPHWIAIARPFAATVALIAAAACAFVVSSSPSWVLAALLAAFAAAMLWLLGGYLRWRSTSLVLTTDRLVLRRGVLGRHGREIPLGRLADVGFDQSPWQRLLGYGSLLLQATGASAPDVIPRIARPAAVQRLVASHLVSHLRRETPAG